MSDYDYDARRKAENDAKDARAVEMEALAGAIAAKIGFTLAPLHEPDAYDRDVARDLTIGDAVLCLRRDLGKNKLTVAGTTGHPLRGFANDFPSATMSLSKGVDGLAKDIARRVVPGTLAAVAKAAEKLAASETHAKRADAAAAVLLAAGNGAIDLRKDNYNVGHERKLYFNATTKLYGNVTLRHDGDVKLEVDHVPAAIATSILALLATGKAP